MDKVKQDVEKKISETKVVVYAKSGCPFCEMTKTMFIEIIKSDDLKQEEYEIVYLNKLSNGDQYQNYFQTTTGARTVPRIFINGKCIGGCSEMKEILKSGKLKEKLQEARTTDFSKH